MTVTYTINTMGATITGTKNVDGTYTVVTQGSKEGAEPTEQIMSESVFAEKYGKYLDDAQFQISNIGCTIYGSKNEDGTYTIIKQGSLAGAEPTEQIMSESVFAEKYGKYLDDAQFQISNIGCTIYGSKNEDGTYTIIKQGSLAGAEPEEEILSEEEFQEEYGEQLDLEV